MRYLRKIQHMYIVYIRNRKEEPRFLIIVFFAFTFITSRLIVYGIKYHILPSPIFGSIIVHDTHVHHLVFGILLLLAAGLIRIPQFGSSLVRFSSILYGIGAGLTLDEFSLWLRFNPDSYFGPQGRLSIDAVVIFFIFLLTTLWHGVFWRKLFKYTLAYFFRKKINEE